MTRIPRPANGLANFYLGAVSRPAAFPPRLAVQAEVSRLLSWKRRDLEAVIRQAPPP